MMLFNWHNQPEQRFEERYNETNFAIIGLDAFQSLASRLPDDTVEFGDLVREFSAFSPRSWPCPRLFISHRMADFCYADRIAWLADKKGWDYWLDVHDSGLAAINSLNLSAKSQALAVALIIEMALLNCTHIIATITANSPGSAWIPYEYGRVKPNSLASKQAASWLHPSSGITPAEYLNLGPILLNEFAINHWMATEKKKFTNCAQVKSNYRGNSSKSPDELPE